MTHELTKRELRACRAFNRLLSDRTEGWAEAEACDRHYDGGEWSGPAWGDNWQEAHERCHQIIAERFEFPSAEYVMHLMHRYEDEEQYRWWKAITRH